MSFDGRCVPDRGVARRLHSPIKNLGLEERHIVQKLFAWADTVKSMVRFREHRKKALADGWNNSGPVQESRALSLIAGELETRIRERLQGLS